MGTKLEISVNSTNKATEHLAKKHSVIATKTILAAVNAGHLNRLLNVATPRFHEDPARFFQLQFATWAAEHSISFNAFKGESWNLIANTLPAPDRRRLMNLDIAKHQFEQYLCIKSKVITELEKVKALYNNIPFLSFNLDLYQNSILNMKFLAIRLSWTHDGSVHSKNLGVRKYNPTYAERESTQASELLFKWAGDLLKEFNVDINEDVYSSIGDGGSDVRHVMEKLCPGVREWCLGHIINLCLVDAFGSHHEKAKSKNLSARNMIEKVRKCIEQVNKSSKLKTKLEEILLVLLGHVVKLKNSPHHRWSAIEDVLSRVLSQWTPLKQAYASVAQHFPLHDDKVVLIEFYSILVPIRRMQIKTQAMRRLTCVLSFLDFIQLYLKTLNPSKPLAIIHPDSGERVLDFRPAHLLHPLLQDVRELFGEGLFDRFFFRYHPIKALINWRHAFGKRATKNNTMITTSTVTLKDFRADYVFEMQSMMHPRGRKISALKHLIAATPINDYPKDFPEEMKDPGRLQAIFIKLLQAALWRHISDTLTRVLSTMVPVKAKKHTPSSDADLTPLAKRVKVSNTYDDILDEAPSYESTNGNNDSSEEREPEPFDPAVKAAEELEKYHKAHYDMSECGSPEYLLGFWRDQRQQEDYMGLPTVAGCLLAMKPGTGGLECDLGGMGDVVAPKRGSLDPGMIEVAMMIKLNRADIERDAGAAPRLGRNWRDFLPGRTEYPPNYFDNCSSVAEEVETEEVVIDDDDSDARESGPDNDVAEVQVRNDGESVSLLEDE